jgi:CBS domain-containing protein
MLVQQILANKGDAAVVSVPPGTTVQAASEVLSRRGIGAVVVSPDGRRVLGVLSERDVVRELGRRGAACMSEPVERLMSTAVVGCACGDTADQVLERMTAGRFRHMPVMDGGAMIGLISIGDVVAARLAELAMENGALEGMIRGF